MRLPLWAWLYDLDTWKAREPRSIERQDCGETMHLHSGDETRIVRGFSDTACCVTRASHAGQIAGVSGRNRNMPLIRSSSRAAATGVIPRPFSPSGPVATTHSSIRFCATIWSFLPCSGRSRIARSAGTIERMMRLKSAEQDAGVYKHALNAIRINALAADGFIAQGVLCGRDFQPTRETAAPTLWDSCSADARSTGEQRESQRFSETSP